MKKTLSILLVVLMLTVIVASLTACNLFKSISLDEARTNLTNAEYTVTVRTGAEYISSEENTYPFLVESELEYYLYAVKGDEEIQMFFFVSTDAASDNYNFMNNDKLLGGQSNSVVYFATKQARKDAGL